MKKKLRVLLIFILFLLCVSNCTSNLLEVKLSNSNTETILDHHSEEDQIFVENGIPFCRNSEIVPNKISLVYPPENCTPIWKPPVIS